MSVCFVSSGNLMGSLSSSYSLSSGYESTDLGGYYCHLRVGVGFDFPLIVLENPVGITDFEGARLVKKLAKIK